MTGSFKKNRVFSSGLPLAIHDLPLQCFAAKLNNPQRQRYPTHGSWRANVASVLEQNVVRAVVRLLSPFLLLGGLSFVASAQGSSSANSVAVIKAGRLLDVESGHLLTNQTITIKNGRIEAIGEQVAVPSGAAIIDLSKFTVLPGLIDCHTH